MTHLLAIIITLGISVGSASFIWTHFAEYLDRMIFVLAKHQADKSDEWDA